MFQSRVGRLELQGSFFLVCALLLVKRQKHFVFQNTFGVGFFN